MALVRNQNFKIGGIYFIIYPNLKLLQRGTSSYTKLYKI